MKKKTTGVSPCGGRHDAAAAVHGHPAAAAALRRVVVHAEIVAELVSQRHRCAQRIVGVILRQKQVHYTVKTEYQQTCALIRQVTRGSFGRRLSQTEEQSHSLKE